MAFQSALSMDASVFAPSAISQQTHAFNQKLMDIMSKGPKWYEVGAAKYRQMRAAGETPLPAAVLLETAEDFTIPSRDAGRSIPCRILRPTNGKPVKAVFMHIHGGGWVLQDEKSQDPALQLLANNLSLLCISIGYRLAPEDPFPAGPNDCYDAAEWLVRNSQPHFNAPLAFTGGESAGAHLAMLVALHLLNHPNPHFQSPNFAFKGLLLHFGCYDLSWTPSVYTYKTPQPHNQTPDQNPNTNSNSILVLSKDLMDAYRNAFLPPASVGLLTFRHPSISPLYADLGLLRGKLPPALFTCGTEDCLLDDTLFMATRWVVHGGAEAAVKIVPGAPHGYIMFPRETEGSGAEEGMVAVEEFVKGKIGD